MDNLALVRTPAAARQDDASGIEPSADQDTAFEREMAADRETTVLGKRDHASSEMPEAVGVKRPRRADALGDASLPVAMKLAGRGDGLPGGVSTVNLAVADRLRQKHGDLGNPKATSHQVAEKREDGWYGVPAGGKAEEARPLDGTFTNATMLDGTIRLGPPGDGRNAHATLTGNAKNVLWAGTSTFDHGDLVRYDNGSGTYVPPAALRFQSGFHQARGFEPVRDPLPVQGQSARNEALAAAGEAALLHLQRQKAG